MSVISDADANRIFLRSLEALHQRIIDLRASFALKDIVLWEGLEDESKYKKT